VALAAEGRPDKQAYGAYHRRRFAEAAAAIAFCLGPPPDAWQNLVVLGRKPGG